MSTFLRPFRPIRPLLCRHYSLPTPSPSSSIRLVEVSPRDGLQNEPSPVSLETKLSLIDRLSHSGLTHIEAGSFVSPKAVPQMSTTPALAPRLPAVPGVTYSFLTPNIRGYRDMGDVAGEVAVFASATEEFSRRNLGRGREEAMAGFEEVVKAARKDGRSVRGYVSMVIQCPWSGPTPVGEVVTVVRRLLEMGCYEVSLGDTNGLGTPGSVKRLLRGLRDEGVPMAKLAGHFHDTYGMGIANVVAAAEEGVRVFDASVAGLGGCPFAGSTAGNVATEEVVWLFEKSGIRTGVDLEKLVETGKWIAGEVGRDVSTVAKAWKST